jgi:16S rRNA (guanine966-N2)-methyltransferase
MRIIGGKYKGQHLVSFQADHIRPTTDRVKETLFNMIQSEIDGSRAVDLFSGTGSLGLEALSRGVDSVLFVEKSKKSIGILEKNLQKLKVDEPHQIINKDVFLFLKSYEGAPFQLIFADPPFTEQLADQVLEAICQSNIFGMDSLVMIESARKEKLVDEYSKAVRVKKKEFGDKVLSFFRHKEFQ